MKSASVQPQLFDDLRELLKAQANTVNHEAATTSHPESSELAAFFYGQAKPTTTAAHLAACQSCADEIALYAKSERAAAAFKPRRKNAEKIPAAAWQMIRDWQAHRLAQPKPPSETVNAEMLKQFARLIANRQDSKSERRAITKAAPHQVPVIVVNRVGDFRGIEVFEQSKNKRGEITLKYLDASGRFDNHELHALLHPDSKTYDVASFPIERNKVRVSKTVAPEALSGRAEYFIIED
ncbi:MAG: hypothetical protein HY231_06415 [Acidobacteria bacterium]|nr:hypothetical protein [Acidobacteriota bacterium]